MWRDASDEAAAYPPAGAARAFDPQRPAYCASNLLADETFVYATMAQRLRVFGGGEGATGGGGESVGGVVVGGGGGGGAEGALAGLGGLRGRGVGG